MIRSRDLGTGPFRHFGAALPARHRGVIDPVPPITVFPRKMKGEPPCPNCGETEVYCGCETGD